MSSTPGFRCDEMELRSGSKSLDFGEINTLESRVRRGIRVKKRRIAAASAATTTSLADRGQQKNREDYKGRN